MKVIEIAGGNTGRRHKRKRSNLSRETEGIDVAIGQGLWASTSREWGNTHVLPWGLQNEAGTTHTSVAFLWPPEPQGDKCPLCKTAMFVEMYYRCLGGYYISGWSWNAGADFKQVRHEGALSFLCTRRGRVLNLRAPSSIIQVRTVFPLPLSSTIFL